MLLAILWVTATAFQYGFHIALFNGLQQSVQTALHLSDAQLGALTFAYTLGGLSGSLSSGPISNTRGKKATVLISSYSIMTGSILMSIAPSIYLLVLGRSVAGFGAGIATSLSSIILAEIAAASRHKSAIEILTQLSITIGIVAAIALAIPFESNWRHVPAVSASIAGLQILCQRVYDEDASLLIARPLDGDVLDSEETGPAPLSAQSTIHQVLTSSDPAVKRGLAVVMVSQLAAQSSGINAGKLYSDNMRMLKTFAVMYYSTSFLSQTVSSKPIYISLLVAVANCLTTFLPMALVERYGRRTLILTSGYLCAASTSLIGLAVNGSSAFLASAATIAFVSSFSIGLGAIPFVLIPEVMPGKSAPAAGSLGLSINWMVNGLIGASFLNFSAFLKPLAGPGAIFWVFTVASVLCATVLGRLYNPR